MDDIATQKKKLREQFLQTRKAMDRKLRVRHSRNILDQLVRWPLYESSHTVHCFMGVEHNGEVDTAPILKRLISDGKRVVIPKALLHTNRLEHYLYSGNEQLEVNRWGIPEPVNGEIIPVSELELVLVPLLAADMGKNRLGYGLGYYDRFLSETQALKAGLLFEECLSDTLIPVDSFDVQLDYLITEKKIY